MTNTQAPLPPLIVLCGHRSGSSLLMGLLGDAGLHLGELLAPAASNPKGFFENRAVVDANRRMLADWGRDWTCPPAAFDHRHVDLAPLEAILESLRSAGRPWGFKDPRTLFALPAWAAAIGDVRLVGVHRNSTDMARSLAQRDALQPEQATAIALAYTQRLAEAHRRLQFPLVSFDDPPDVFLERTERIAVLLGLTWDADKAGALYDSKLVHHRTLAEEQHQVDAYLAGAAQIPVESLNSFTAATIVRSWDSLPADLATSLPMNLGPRYLSLRSELLKKAVGLLPDVGDVALVEDRARPARLGGIDAVSVTPQVVSEMAGGASGSGSSWSHVVAPLLLDVTAAEELSESLAALEKSLDARAVIALSGWVYDGDRLPAVHQFQPAAVTARRSAPPYLHHIDELAAMLLHTRLHLAAANRTHDGRTQLLLTNDPTLGLALVAPSQLRRHIVDLDRQLARSTEEVERLGDLRDAERESLRAVTRQRDEARIEGVELRSRLAEAHTATGEAQKDAEEARRDAAELQSALAASDQRLREAENLKSELDRELAEVRGERDELGRRAKQSHAWAETLKASNSRLERRLEKAETKTATARRSYDRLAGRRIVRFALAVARPLGPMFRLVRRTRRHGGQTEGAPTARMDTTRSKTQPRPVAVYGSRDELIRAVKGVRTTTYPVSGPMVSIVILTRDGAHHLRRLFPGLEATRYRSFEVVLIDNGSTDDTAAVLESEWSFPIEVITNDHNLSFSDGNNRGVEAASGGLVLLLNNDLEPITEDWLGAMVTAMDLPTSPVAVGALLAYPERGDPDTDLTVQHRGTGFRFRDGAPHAANLAGVDAGDPDLTGAQEVPAVTAAALLMRRKDFETVGGFAAGYVYGAEDVDLCLKLRRLGPVVLQGDAVLFHYESATQTVVEPDIVRINRMGNWQQFAETWGPTLSRSIVRDRLTGEGRWTGRRGRTVAITLTQDDISKGWGDYYTGHELGDAMAAAGWDVVFAERHQDRWYELSDDVDLVISLLDSYDVRRAPRGAFTIAWVRNWVDRWCGREWFDSYDLVVASSYRAADLVSERSRHVPPVVPIATNPERFFPGPPHPSFAADYSFTGNYWGVGRTLIPLLDIRPDERFLLFGKNWDKDPRMRRYWRGHLSYDLMPELYRSVRVILDDNADPTDAGVNSRVFDALASGAVVLTDNVGGSAELFDGLLPVYRDRAEFRRELNRLLADEDARVDLAQRLRSVVMANHTYAHRAEEFPRLAIEATERPRVAVKVGAPRPEEAHLWGDYHFAQSLVRALGHQGLHGEVHLLPEWDDPSRQDCDVVLHLRGLSTYAPKPSHVNVLWIISHPDDVTPEECEKYDLVCVASSSLADKLASAIDSPVVFLPQATDAERFASAQLDDELRTDLLFVGNSRREHRNAVEWAVERGLPLSVYGADWEGLIPERYVRDTYFPNEELASLYASATIVLNDHWPDMRKHGIVSNRILDVLAAGGLVLSDPVEGMEQLLGDAVPTFDSPGGLADAVARYLTDPQAGRAMAAKGRQTVLEHHTFDHRAARLVELIGPMLNGRPRDCDGHRFGLVEAQARTGTD